MVTSEEKKDIGSSSKSGQDYNRKSIWPHNKINKVLDSEFIFILRTDKTIWWLLRKEVTWKVLFTPNCVIRQLLLWLFFKKISCRIFSLSSIQTLTVFSWSRRWPVKSWVLLWLHSAEKRYVSRILGKNTASMIIASLAYSRIRYFRCSWASWLLESYFPVPSGNLKEEPNTSRCSPFSSNGFVWQRERDASLMSFSLPFPGLLTSFCSLVPDYWST